MISRTQLGVADRRLQTMSARGIEFEQSAATHLDLVSIFRHICFIWLRFHHMTPAIAKGWILREAPILQFHPEVGVDSHDESVYPSMELY